MGGTGSMDIRLPIGLMFGIMGLMLTAYGAMTNGSEIYTEHSLGINIDLIWGVVLVVFALVMLGLVWKAPLRESGKIKRD